MHFRSKSRFIAAITDVLYCMDDLCWDRLFRLNPEQFEACMHPEIRAMHLFGIPSGYKI